MPLQTSRRSNRYLTTRSGCVTSCLGLAAFACGCVDTRAALEDFGERYARTHDASTVDAAGDGAPCNVPLPDELAGRFELVISPSFSPKTPILFVADVTAQAQGPDQLAVGLTLTAVSASDRETPVGNPLPPREFTLGAGSFDADLGTLEIAGDADPIIPGAPISGRLILSGRLCSTRGPDAAVGSIEFLCGDARGNVTTPATLDLAGSTWAALRVADQAPLPSPVLDCAMTPPDPL